MADRTAEIAVSDAGPDTTTSSTYAAVISQAFTGAASTDYWLIASCLNWLASGTVQQKCRLINTTDAVTLCEQGYQQKDASDKTSFLGIGKFTTSGSPSSKTFELQHANSDNSQTKSMSDATFTILKKHADDQYSEDLTGSTITNTAGQDTMEELAFTNDGDYYVIGYFEAQISSVTPRMQASLNINAAVTRAIDHDFSDNGQYRAFWFIDKVTASGAQSYKLTAGLTSAGTITWRNAKILALSAESFDNTYYGEQETRQTNADKDAWVDVATLTATPLNLQHLVLASMVLDHGSTVTSGLCQFVEGATVKGGEMIQEGSTSGTAGGGHCHGAAYVATLAAASTTWKTQVHPETDGTTTGGDDSAIVVLQLAPTPAGGSLIWNPLTGPLEAIRYVM